MDAQGKGWYLYMYDNLLYPQLLRIQKQKTFEKYGDGSRLKVSLDKDLTAIKTEVVGIISNQLANEFLN